MARWGLILMQDGGCDYTIGCGVRTYDLDATTREEAVKEARLIAIGIPDWEEKEEYNLHGFHGESELLSAHLITWEGELPLADWYMEYDQASIEVMRTKENSDDLIEFERLKRKLGK